MYEYFREKLNPLPTFNLTWNTTTDSYSEGSIEDDIVNFLASNSCDNYANVIASNFSWSTFYHLTDFRSNILNWYPFDKNASVLEIGCGFGAITQTLCEKCSKVTAVELSERRASGTLFRCRDYSNLEIIVGNLNDIVFEDKFDYITLIGVLEYQGKYTKTKDPYVDFLKNIKKLLKPDGKLLIAIENQFGIKYWCGTCEDHTNIPFDGLNDYSLSNSGVRTFSKSSLDNLIKKSGFLNTFFYYPMPDYKLPTVVFSEKYLPKSTEDFSTPYTSVGKNTIIANEANLYKELIDNSVFDFFANSFLVECSDAKDLGSVIYAKCNTVRLPEYQIGTRITSQNKVEKFPLRSSISSSALDLIVNSSDDLSNHNINVVKYEHHTGSDIIISDYIENQGLNSIIQECINDNNAKTIYYYMDKIWEDILKSSTKLPPEDNLMYTFDGFFEEKDYGPILQTGYLDLISRNAYIEGSSLKWIDQEWVLENIPAKYIMYRNINYLYSDFPSLNNIISTTDMLNKYGILDYVSDFSTLENLFLGSILDDNIISEYNMFKTATSQDIVGAIKRLLQI